MEWLRRKPAVASGRVCAICGLTIGDEVEAYEGTLDGVEGILLFHPECFDEVTVVGPDDEQ